MSEYGDYRQIEQVVPFTGHRRFVAYTYMTINFFGFVVNFWVLYVIVPVLFFRNANVPKSILFYILVLCISDLMTMIAMVFLNLDILFGTWRFSPVACTAYLLFESVNKFMAPIIVLLMSHTCYASICLDARHQQRAASAKFAAIKVLIALLFVMLMILPVFLYSHVFTVFFNVNEAQKQVSYVKKCSYVPPNSVEVLFNFVVCVVSYLIPFCGFLYWYVSVPYFLWKRKRRATALAKKTVASESTALHTPEISSTSFSSMNSTPMVTKIPDAVIRKVVLTVLILSLTYLLCWTPYWVGLYVVLLFQIKMTKSVVITMYFVHLLPYISCAAYPFIFTVMNRAIQSAHSQLVDAQKRRLRNFTRRTSRCLRDALTVDSRLSGYFRARFCGDSITENLNKAAGPIDQSMYPRRVERVCEMCARQNCNGCDSKRSSLSKGHNNCVNGTTPSAALFEPSRKPSNMATTDCCCFFDFAPLLRRDRTVAATAMHGSADSEPTSQAISADLIVDKDNSLPVIEIAAFRPPLLQYDNMRAIDSSFDTERSLLT